jgi:DNA-binding NtrC family response regulator
MKCILIVEDEGDVREILVDVIRDAGYQIVEAGSGDAAAILLQLGTVRMIVTDIDLPGTLDGIGLAELAREVHPGMPVVFISGRPAKLAEAKRFGDPVSFLQKPFNLTSLIEDVNRLARD